MAIGISLANLFDMSEALDYMRDWLKFNANYSKLVSAWPDWAKDSLLGDKQIAMKNMLLSALKTNPNDYKLNEALGVLSITTNDFTSATEHFKTALSLQYIQ
jgi:uncharacterized protein HemY